MSLQFQSYIYVVSPHTDQKQSVFDWLERETNNAVSPADMLYINEEIESSISIEDIRKLQQELAYSVAADKKRYVAILHSETMTLAAQNAALKIVEEPPAHTHIMLITDQPEKLIPTIQSRCFVIFATDDSQETTSDTVDKELVSLYTSIPTLSYGELIIESEKYSSKSEAINFTQDLVKALTRTLSKDANVSTIIDKHILHYSSLSKHILILHETLRQLRGNVNSKLAIAECFFELKRTAL